MAELPSRFYLLRYIDRHGHPNLTLITGDSIEAVKNNLRAEPKFVSEIKIYKCKEVRGERRF